MYSLTNFLTKNLFISFQTSLTLFISIIYLSNCNAQSKIEIEGVILDNSQITIPYAAITIIAKNKGTSSTGEGTFSMLVTKHEMLDTLTISSMGFETKKIQIQEYLKRSNKKITLEEIVTTIDEVKIIQSVDIVKNALKALKKNTISDVHQIELLYRRASAEGNKSKFFIENYIKIKDRGPKYLPKSIEIAEARKSADYRIWKRNQGTHSINYMMGRNPLRPTEKQPYLKKYKWKKTGDTSYDNEDVVIIEGTNGYKHDDITFYIGLDSYSIYKIVRPRTLFLYKKHKNGKLYLSYFTREWTLGQHIVPERYKKTEAKYVTYKSEVFVYKVITDKNKIKVRNIGSDTDMAELKLPYHPNFWKNFSAPPITEFYKKIKSDLESHFGVSLETQYHYSNK
jgi:hypothetical protein